jgi:hypothetical protein
MDFEMTNMQMLTITSSLVVVLFGIIMALLGWLGTRLYDQLVSIKSSMSSIHDRINGIDKRLVAVESQCKFEHDRRSGK